MATDDDQQIRKHLRTTKALTNDIINLLNQGIGELKTEDDVEAHAANVLTALQLVTANVLQAYGIDADTWAARVSAAMERRTRDVVEVR